MVYAELQSYNLTQGPQILLCYVNDVASGVFMPSLYLSIWAIMVIGSFIVTKVNTGSGDLPVSLSLGSFTTLIFAIFMRIISCPYLPLTSDLALAVSIGILFLSVLFLLLSDN